MPFNFTSLPTQLVDVVGVATNMRFGIIALSGGTATVKTGHMRVKSAWAQSQTSNTARVSDITGDGITITGTGTDVAMWFAIGDGGR